MHRNDWVKVLASVTLSSGALACGGDGPTDPPDAVYGETTVVYLLNPTVNDVNVVTVPAPGSTRAGVQVAVASGPSGSTGSTGDLALAPVDPGVWSVTFSAGGDNGDLELDIGAGDLREIAVALTGSGAAEMAAIRYAFGGTVTEISPSMSAAEVNALLAGSNQVVFMRSGTYQGDLEFSGSDITLFGEGARGGTVTINGNVLVSGSRNRLRGARVLGDLSVPGSSAGISYSRVGGDFTLSGSDAVLLNNAFCGSAVIAGSGLRALGNAGLAPLPAPSGGC